MAEVSLRPPWVRAWSGPALAPPWGYPGFSFDLLRTCLGPTLVLPWTCLLVSDLLWIFLLFFGYVFLKLVPHL
jgi:hypothetical protein